MLCSVLYIVHDTLELVFKKHYRFHLVFIHQMIKALQVLRIHLLELEKVSQTHTLNNQHMSSNSQCQCLLFAISRITLSTLVCRYCELRADAGVWIYDP